MSTEQKIDNTFTRVIDDIKMIQRVIPTRRI